MNYMKRTFKFWIKYELKLKDVKNEQLIQEIEDDFFYRLGWQKKGKIKVSCRRRDEVE